MIENRSKKKHLGQQREIKSSADGQLSSWKDLIKWGVIGLQS